MTGRTGESVFVCVSFGNSNTGWKPAALTRDLNQRAADFCHFILENEGEMCLITVMLIMRYQVIRNVQYHDALVHYSPNSALCSFISCVKSLLNSGFMIYRRVSECVSDIMTRVK